MALFFYKNKKTVKRIISRTIAILTPFKPNFYLAMIDNDF